MTVRRSAKAALAALAFAASGVFCVPGAGAATLSPWDSQLYAAAFAAVKKGDFATADLKLSQVKDRCLVGLVEFEKLFHPTAYKATYQDLTDWLSKYADLSVAPRVIALARKRKPEGQADPDPASTAPRSWDGVAAAEPDVAGLNPKAPREALNAGDLAGAVRLADAANDSWTGGLAAFRMRDFAGAEARFSQVAFDVTEDPWVRAGGGVWAARAAVAQGAPDRAPALLRVAAQFPATFYGQIAQRQLGLKPTVRTGAIPYAEARPAVVRAVSGPDLNGPDLRRFIESEPRAKRALALAELGQREDAGLELRAGLRSALDPQARRRWMDLALGVNALFAAPASAPDARDYPLPDLQPQGGFTVDRALVLALIRQESRFDPTARSYAGAYGLMQLMPATAAIVSSDDGFRASPDRLLDPATNLRVGQDYVAWLMSQGPIAGDLLRTVAAYNGGPAPVFATVKQLGPDADALTIIESIPVPQSRDYVERVMANYWIYKRLLGEATPSLDMVASGARTVHALVDRPPASPAPPATPATPTPGPATP